jgi:hypothetical protein
LVNTKCGNNNADEKQRRYKRCGIKTNYESAEMKLIQKVDNNIGKRV